MARRSRKRSRRLSLVPMAYPRLVPSCYQTTGFSSTLPPTQQWAVTPLRCERGHRHGRRRLSPARAPRRSEEPFHVPSPATPVLQRTEIRASRTGGPAQVLPGRRFRAVRAVCGLAQPDRGRPRRPVAGIRREEPHGRYRGGRGRVGRIGGRFGGSCPTVARRSIDARASGADRQRPSRAAGSMDPGPATVGRQPQRRSEEVRPDLES